MTTGLQIVTKAMQKIGVLVKSESPDSDESNDALDALNDLLDSWSTNSILIPSRTRESFTLSGGTGSYLIGSSQTFNTTLPVAIIDAYVTNGTTDTIVSIINDDKYDSIPLKTTQGIPYWLHYNNAYPYGTIKLYPVPAAAYTLTILSEKPLTSITLGGTISVSPGVRRALIYNLAVEIASEYGQPVSQDIMRIAMESKGAISAAIMRNRSLDCNAPYAGKFNVYSGI